MLPIPALVLALTVPSLHLTRPPRATTVTQMRLTLPAMRADDGQAARVAWYSEWQALVAKKQRLRRLRHPRLMATVDEMPPQLAEWGCDEALWSQIKGARRDLRRLAREGGEEQARKRIDSIRKIVEADAAHGSAAAAGGNNQARRNVKKAKPLSAGYEMGDVPLLAGMDQTEIADLVGQRVEAKKKRDFKTADALQDQLLSMGIRCDDRRRTWNVVQN